jgi:hypothetical protein
MSLGSALVEIVKRGRLLHRHAALRKKTLPKMERM